MLQVNFFFLTGEFLRLPSRFNILWFFGMYVVFFVFFCFFFLILLENLKLQRSREIPHTVNLIFLLAAYKA